MKNYKLSKHLLLLSLFCMLSIRYQQASAQVDKAMKFAWFFDYERAEKFLSNPQNKLNDSMVVELAEVLYLQGKYPQALYYYKIADKRGAIHTPQIRRNYVFASTMMREKSPYYKKSDYFKSNYFLYTVIDTFAGNSGNEDLAPFYWNNMVFVTTSRRTMSNEKAFHSVYTKLPYLDVYPFTEKGKQLHYPPYLPKTINTAVNDGPITISADTNLIVISRNYTKANAKDVQNLYITYYLRDSRKKWSKALPFNFCKPAYSFQHPFYNESDKMLYFTSDMPGGSGGFDLYKSKWNGTQWTPPVNLGDEINSEFDEVFPGFTPEGELVYASNHIETTGGLDIVLFSNNTRYLLNEPFNTIYDDFGLNFKSKKEGYFSSNRFCNKFDDNVYHFTLSEPEKQTLYVKIFDAETRSELDVVDLNISNADGTYSKNITTTVGDNIAVQDTADARKPLHFAASKPGYINNDLTNNDFVVKEGKLYKEIFLQKSPLYAADDYYVVENNKRGSKFASILQNDSMLGSVVQPKDIYMHILSNPLEGFMTVDQEDGKIKIGSGTAPGTYNFNYTICSQKMPELCDTAQVRIVVRSTADDEKNQTNSLTDNNENETVGIRAINDTGFTTVNGGYVMNVRNNDRLKGRKATQMNSVIRNERSDNPGLSLNRRTGVVTMKKGVPAGTYHLYYEINQRGNRDVVGQDTITIVVRNRNQIPVKGSMESMQVRSDDNILYFNNDEPGAFQIFRPAFTYQNTYESYLKQKEKFYQKSADSKSSLDTFFTSYLEGGFDDLNSALQMIQSKLNQGVQVEILVTAYCSPIASTAYNNKLSTRRLISVIRYLKKWNDGGLFDAIESNRIIFWEHAVGELQAPKDVSGDYNKLSESVFGIKASLERRVSLTVKIMEAK